MSSYGLMSRSRYRGLRLFAALAVTLLSAGCGPAADEGVADEQVSAGVEEAAHDDLVARGEYLVMIGGCNDCHTPFILGPNGPEPDLTRMLSGHPQDLPVGPQMTVPAEAGLWMWAPHNTSWVSAAGTAYAFNLTPDVNTGIGIWTEDQFIQTLRTGRHWGVARPILPPMPWFNYGKMEEQDLKAVWAYLRTIPAVSNRVPEAVIAPPPTTPAG